MQKFIKKIALLLAMVLTFFCVTVGVNGNVALAKKTTQAQKAKKAYAAKLAQCAKGKNIFNLVGSMYDLEFTVMNLNKDSVPELIVTGDDWYHSYVYSYINGKVKCIAEGFSGELTFYPSKGVIRSETMHGRSSEVIYWKFDGKKSKMVAYKDGDSSSHYSYKVNGKKVSAKKYNSYVKKLKGKAKSVKQSKVKLVRNTSSNRAKKLGYKK